MARAKRTSERNAARRRFRQAQLDAGAGDASADDAAAPPPAATQGRPAARPGFTAAFRNSYHRANVREDLPYLPVLVRHWSFWIPLSLMVGSGVAAAIAPQQPAVIFLYQTFVLPPALIVLFICGFFAKRASYLLGLLLGLANVIVYGALLAYAAGRGLAALTPEQVQLAILNGAIFSPPAGVLFCSLAAWYRRFLYLSSPNRGRRPPPKGKARPNRRPLLGR